MMIGGYGSKPKKERTMIGGEDYAADEETESDEGPMMDQKQEAAAMLAKALGVSPERVPRIAKALEAFIYACQE